MGLYKLNSASLFGRWQETKVVQFKKEPEFFRTNRPYNLRIDFAKGRAIVRNRRAFMWVGAVQAVSFSGWDVREL